MVPKLAISDPKMKPKPPPEAPTDDLFRNRLENLINPRHELVRLAGLIDWAQFDARWGEAFCEVGRPATPTRLIAGSAIIEIPAHL